jgi:predicted Co/Zn/Cd cation transporter (cation efflux family)
MRTPIEQTILKRSIAATMFVGGSAILLGMLSASMSIVFDGVFSLVDAAMTLLALNVTRLIARENSTRFQMGYWHTEPMVLVLNGGLLTLLSFYALVNAASSFLSGGRHLVFDWAVAYTVLVSAICLGMFLYVRRSNRTIRSDFLALDMKGWAMSGLINTALLAAFIVGAILEKTDYGMWVPYIDPAILCILTLCLLPVPIKTVFDAFKDILLVAPRDLDQLARKAAENAVARHGFAGYRSYVAKVGRSRMIEIYLIVPRTMEIGTVDRLDAIRAEIGNEIGDPGPDRWLTIAFTGDVKWAD